MLIKNKPVTLTFFVTLFQTMSIGVMFSLTVLIFNAFTQSRRE